MNNAIINIISNENVVAEKRSTRIKKSILASAVSFGMVIASTQNGLSMQKKILENAQVKRLQSQIVEKKSR